MFELALRKCSKIHIYGGKFHNALARHPDAFFVFAFVLLPCVCLIERINKLEIHDQNNVL